MSESEWEGGRQPGTSKLILAKEQTVVPEQELRLVHLPDAFCTTTKENLITVAISFPRVKIPSRSRVPVLDRGGCKHTHPQFSRAATTQGKRRCKVKAWEN